MKNVVFKDKLWSCLGVMLIEGFKLFWIFGKTRQNFHLKPKKFLKVRKSWNMIFELSYSKIFKLSGSTLGDNEIDQIQCFVMVLSLMESSVFLLKTEQVQCFRMLIRASRYFAMFQQKFLHKISHSRISQTHNLSICFSTLQTTLQNIPNNNSNETLSHSPQLAPLFLHFISNFSTALNQQPPKPHISSSKHFKPNMPEK
jgi:hypothetical protein